VTEQPGTTRDAIEAPAVCGGFPFRLVDTAGLHEATDRIERMGIEVSRRYLAAADMVMFCVEAGRPLDAEETGFLAQSSAPTLLVRTKADRAETADPHGPADVLVSAESGEGLDALRAALAESAFTGLASTGTVEMALTRARHRVAVTTALEEIVGFREARSAGIEALVAASHLHAAAGALREVIGVVYADDVLARVFATFCVGK
jgi:tRNA modification GTPase